MNVRIMVVGRGKEKRRTCKKETFDLHRWIEQQEEEELYHHGANVAVDNQEVVMVVPCKVDN